LSTCAACHRRIRHPSSRRRHSLRRTTSGGRHSSKGRARVQSASQRCTMQHRILKHHTLKRHTLKRHTLARFHHTVSGGRRRTRLPVRLPDFPPIFSVPFRGWKTWRPTSWDRFHESV
jgi:hypothetical protein